METIEVAGQRVSICMLGCHGEDGALPVVYLHVVPNEAQEIASRCEKLGVSGAALVFIEGFAWNDAMTPWASEGLFGDDAPFAGKAAAQLTLLEQEIVPRAEAALGEAKIVRAIVGYSLAGLFAIWASLESKLFSAVASVSGSLWYPGFREYVFNRVVDEAVSFSYFSLGDKEARTPNRLLRTVEDDTRQIQRLFVDCGSISVFEMNPGNHFKDPALRVAKGIYWLSERLC